MSVNIIDELDSFGQYAWKSPAQNEFWGPTPSPSDVAFLADQFEALRRGLWGSNPSMRREREPHNPVWERLRMFLAEVRDVLNDHGELTGVGFQHVGVTYDDDLRAVRHQEILDRWERQW